MGLITNGILNPGDRVSEAEIARQLGISRSPVHEAFVRMIKDGLLAQSPRHGVFVAEMTDDEVREIVGFREVVEGFAAREACKRIRPEEISRLRGILAEGAAAGRAGDWLTMEEKNAEFHDVLVACARHRLLSRVWAMLTPTKWKLTPGTRPRILDESGVQDFLARHEAIVEALESGDPNRAEQVSVAHVRQVARNVVELRRRFDSQSPDGR